MLVLTNADDAAVSNRLACTYILEMMVMGVVEIHESATTTTTTIQRDSQTHSRTSPQLLLRLWSVSPADILDLSSFFAHTVASKLRLQPRHFGPQTLQPEISQHCQPQSLEDPLCCLYALRSRLSDVI